MIEKQNKKQNKKQINERLWNRIAIVAGVFSFIISILLIGNFLQTKSADPVETKVINTLVEQLSQDQNNNELREEIRAIDLLARKAFFTNQWQIRTGSYLLLIGILIVIVAMLIIDYNKKIDPKISDDKPQDILLHQKYSRRWVALGGGAIVAIALISAFLTHNELGNTFSKAAITDIDVNIEKDIENNNEAATKEPATETLIEPENKTEEQQQEKDIIKEKEKEPVINKEVVNKPEEDKKLPEQPKKVSKTSKGNSFVTANTDTKNFSSFRGPGGNGIDFHKNIPTSFDGKAGTNILWKFPIPLHGYNSPIIWGNKVFITGANGNTRTVYCLHKDSGKLLWKTDFKGISGSPAKSPDVTQDTGHAAPTMTTDGKQVYAIFANGDVTALDMNGKMVWGKNLGVPQNHYGHSSSLLVYNNKLIVQFDHRKEAKILALSTKDGKIVWNTPRTVKISWASPVLVNTGSRDEVIIASNPMVASYNPETGKELWKIDCISGEVGPSVAYANGLVFSVNEYSVLSAIKLGDTPEILWEGDEYLSDVPSPIATDDFLLLPTSYGVVACYNPKTGEKYWEQEFDNGFYSSPMLVDNKVYLIDTEGIMYIFKLGKEYVSVGKSALGEKTFATPSFTDGRIYIRADKNLYCIGTK